MKKKHSGLTAYAQASQLTFVVITPLLLFIFGGQWLVDRFDLPGWVLVVLILLGVLTMISGLITFCRNLIKIYGKDDKRLDAGRLSEKKTPGFDRRDNDYYVSNDKKPLL